MKKIFFLYLSVIFSLLTIQSFNIYAADTDELVTVSVYSKQYYGTLNMQNDSTAVFTNVNNDSDLISIEGAWKDEAFDGDCTITYSDDSIQNVKFKNGLISGTVTHKFTDGTYKIFKCKKGFPNLEILTYSSDQEVINQDWFFRGVPIQTWVANASRPDYSSLFNTVNEYLEKPFCVSGSVTGIYELFQQKIIKIIDDNGNIYLFKYRDTQTARYTPAEIAPLNIGETVTIYGIYEGLKEADDTSYLLFNNVMGYNTDFPTVSSEIVDDSFALSYNKICSISDPDMEQELPLFTAFKCDSELSLSNEPKKNYKNICDYPYYFSKTSIKLQGTIVYLTEEQIFIQKKGTSDIYVASAKKSQEKKLAIGDVVSCKATIDGMAKIPCYNSSNNHFQYVLYPYLTSAKVNIEK